MWQILAKFSLGPYLLFRKRSDNFCAVFTYSIKRAHEIRKFHIVVVHGWQRNVHNSVIHVQSCCLLIETFYSFAILLAVTLVVGFVVIQKKCYHGNVMSHFSLKEMSSMTITTGGPNSCYKER